MGVGWCGSSMSQKGPLRKQSVPGQSGRLSVPLLLFPTLSFPAEGRPPKVFE